MGKHERPGKGCTEANFRQNSLCQGEIAIGGQSRQIENCMISTEVGDCLSAAELNSLTGMKNRTVVAQQERIRKTESQSESGALPKRFN
jgi:hypothetical protein